MQQTAAYMDRCGVGAGYLVIFDRGGGQWEGNVFCWRESCDETEIYVWGM